MENRMKKMEAGISTEGETSRCPLVVEVGRKKAAHRCVVPAVWSRFNVI
jgi:hypothetical protein